MAAHDVLTLDEAGAAVNLPSGSTAQDPRLQLYVSGISGRVDKLCGPVVQRTITGERHNGGNRGCSKILLRTQHVDSVTSLTEWAGTVQTALTAETDSVKPVNGFLLDTGEGDIYAWVIRRSGNGDASFPAGRRNIAVTYVAGRYADTASVGETFKLAVGSVLRRIWKRESSSWAQSPDFFADTENPTPGLGFYKAVDPMVCELLGDELLPPVGI